MNLTALLLLLLLLLECGFGQVGGEGVEQRADGLVLQKDYCCEIQRHGIGMHSGRFCQIYYIDILNT
jgi:hypothetical protein